MKHATALSRIRESTLQITAANRRGGHQKAVHRIQGFVAGALFVTAVDLARQILFGSGHQPGQEAVQYARQLAVAWATAMLAALVYAGIVACIDRNEKEPWQMLLVAFLWGTVVSGSIAGLLNRVWGSYVGPYLVERGFIAGAFSIAPFTEELTKGSLLLLIAWYASGEFDGALDGIVYGAMVGIGFAMQENAGYFFAKAPATEIVDQMHSYQFFLRVVLKGLAGHATYTAITGLGLGLTRQVRRRWLKIALPALGLTIAILAHAMWNSQAVHDMLDSKPLVAHVALINGPFFAGVVIAVVVSWRKEAQVIAKQLLDELDPSDPYTAPAVMFTSADRFRARWRTLRKRGVSAWWALRRLQQAWIELAFCKWHGQEANDLRQRIQVLRSQLEPSSSAASSLPRR